MIKKLLPLSILLLSGCTHETMGEIGGGAVGALVGSQIGGGKGRMVATAVGAIAGSKLGGYLGKKIDKAEEKRIEQAAQMALAKNSCVEWQNNTHEFQVKPMESKQGQKRVSVLMKEKGGTFKEVELCQRSDGTLSVVND